MEKTRIYNLVILDASGSMCSIKRQAIDGFNETVQTIKAAQAKFESQEHLVSLVVFNSDSTTTLYDRVAADKVQELNAETPLTTAIEKAKAVFSLLERLTLLPDRKHKLHPSAVKTIHCLCLVWHKIRSVPCQV